MWLLCFLVIFLGGLFLAGRIEEIRVTVLIRHEPSMLGCLILIGLMFGSGAVCALIH